MAEVQTQLAALSITAGPRDSVEATAPVAGPPQTTAPKPRRSLALNTFSPVNQNGSFEFDRVIKCGYVQKRTQKTKVYISTWHPLSHPGDGRNGCSNKTMAGVENHLPGPEAEHTIHLQVRQGGEASPPDTPLGPDSGCPVEGSKEQTAQRVWPILALEELSFPGPDAEGCPGVG